AALDGHPARVDGDAQDGAPHHPQHPRGGPPRRPRRRHEPPAGPHRRDPRHRPAAAPAPGQAAAALRRVHRPHPGDLQGPGRAGHGLMDAPRFQLLSVDRFERDVRLRMPFRFGVVTLTEAPQAFARVRIRLAGGREAEGGAAEMLAPKWFDKSPGLSNEDNFDQLRLSLALAADAYLGGGAETAFGHWIAGYQPLIDRGAARGLNSLTACFGPALLDRAVLDAVCRAL